MLDALTREEADMYQRGESPSKRDSEPEAMRYSLIARLPTAFSLRILIARPSATDHSAGTHTSRAGTSTLSETSR